MKKGLKTAMALIVLCIFCAGFFGGIIPFLPIRVKAEYNNNSNPLVLDLWHIESFEGGIGSRADWIAKRALTFEKQHKGVYVSVAKMTYEQLQMRLTEGYCFDIISFGCGVGQAVLRYLQPYEGNVNAYQNLVDGGRLDGVLYALPYMAGGYLVAGLKSSISKINGFVSILNDIFNCSVSKKIGKNLVNIKSLGCGFGEFNSPLTALSLGTDVLAKNNDVLAVEESFSQYAAYEAFLTGKRATLLLGTQRDYFRLTSRVKNGKLGEVSFECLNGFSDLIQYVALGKTGDIKKTMASELFAEYLTSDACQKTLINVGMLPVKSMEIYSDGFLRQMSNNVASVRTPSAFIFKQAEQQLKKISFEALFNGEKNNIKNYLC